MGLSDLPDRFERVLLGTDSKDFPVFIVPADQLVIVVEHLRDVEAFTLLVDLTAIDFGETVEPRFSGRYHFYSPKTHDYVRLQVPCAGTQEEPTLPTLVHLFPGANWHERECFDLLGVRFDGHPDLRRILMWDGYPHHPLRKEFPLAGIDTAHVEEDVRLATAAGVDPIAAPMMGGPFVAPQRSRMSDREPFGRDESWSEAKPKPNKP
ncbi:MAG: NADH-quinone oxidoreductase subunit C [Opitutales bacterium]